MTRHPLVRLGTSQDERVARALPAEQVKLDDRDLAQLLTWMQGYAKELVYYAPAGHPAGTWERLLRDDESMLAAEIQCCDLGKLERGMHDLEQGQEKSRREVADECRRLVLLVERWRERAVVGMPAHRALTHANNFLSSFDTVNDLEEHAGVIGGCVRRLIRAAPDFLRASLEQHAAHRPHLGLILAFLQLYQNHAQALLNTIPRRHLDFYYRRVLGLAARPAVPDQAHVVVELSKRISSHRLEKGTRFWATDPVGAKVQFELEEEFVPNRASVAQVAALVPKNVPFKCGRSVELDKQHIELAVATPFLRMAGGTRTITLNLTRINVDLVGCRLTGAGKWIELENKQKTGIMNERDAALRSVRHIDATDPSKMTIRIDASQPAIVDFDPSVHAEFSDVLAGKKSEPLLILRFRATPDNGGIQIGVKSLSVECKELPITELRTQAGLVKLDKPVTLLHSVEYTADWKQAEVLPTKVSLNAKWNVEHKSGKMQGDTFMLDDLGYSAFMEDIRSIISATKIPPGQILAVSRKTARIASLAADAARLGQKGRQEMYAEIASIWSAIQEDLRSKIVIPTPPIPPVLKSLTLDYTSAETTDLKIFHVLPFGFRELPQPTAGRPTEVPDDWRDIDGALHIGVENLERGQILSLLVQVAEGDTPSVERPKVEWFYLAGDEWMPLPSGKLLVDRTEGLRRSGIIRVDLPDEADTVHFVMPTGLRWLRAAVNASPEGVAKLVAIRAQAARVVYVDDGQHPNRLASPLPPRSITKLVVRDPAIKAIEQPFSSWGGVVGEPRHSSEASSDPRYERRVHERLRHKGRALTMWDYERLVLEHFPEVYRVKCLPHTNALGERAPGEVKVVVVANLGSASAADPMQPQASQDTLARIEEFLLKRSSPHLKQLKVDNPKFTKVVVGGTVEFVAGLDEGNCKARLKNDLARFLCPWAFDAGRRSELRFGASVPASKFIDFMHDLRDYVDHVVSLSLKINGIIMPDAEAEGDDAILVLGQHELGTGAKP